MVSFSGHFVSQIGWAGREGDVKEFLARTCVIYLVYGEKHLCKSYHAIRSVVKFKACFSCFYIISQKGSTWKYEKCLFYQKSFFVHVKFKFLSFHFTLFFSPKSKIEGKSSILWSHHTFILEFKKTSWLIFWGVKKVWYWN